MTFHLPYTTEKESAPAPARICIGLGGMLFSDKKINLDISGTFFRTYCDYTDSGKTVYTEIENRTAQVYGIMLDCTARYKLIKGNHRFNFGGGLGFLAQFAEKDEYVPASEEWKIGEINKEIWNPSNLFYPVIAVSWMYNASDKIQAGLELKSYYGFNQTKLAFTFKLAYGKSPWMQKPEEKSVKMERDSSSVTGESL